ncbi:MAG TPA: patatin-like phospholipase family protein [Cytophagaceae bacterium]|jgi:NTE family protein
MKVGIALSGGGVRSFCQLGALKALKEHGVVPELISGTSGGAVVGALYAAGLEPNEVLDILLTTPIYRYVRPVLSRYGFLRIEKLASLYNLYLPKKTFESLPIKLVISATDINHGKTIYFTEGDLVRALLASSCIPILFRPVEIDGRLMVDGGILNNMPVEPLMGNCDFIIGIHSNPNNEQFQISNIKKMIERTFHLAIYNNVHERVKYCDLFIEPPALKVYGLFDFSKSKEIFEIGYNFTKNLLSQSPNIFEKT